jgi:Kef-type K+ transport system membrane component KefB
VRYLARGAIVLWFTAVLFVAGGLYAYFTAPPEANATTALIIPSVSASVLIALGIATWFLRASSRGRFALGAGAVMCMVFALLFMMPAMARQKQLRNYPAALEAWKASPLSADPATPRDARRVFFRERQSPDHDTTYLVTTLFSLKAVAWAGGLVCVILAAKSRRAMGTGA